MAVREPYAPPENEDLAAKFDRMLGITTAETNGWHVVGGKRSSVSDNKPKKSALSMAAANAALDSVLPKAPGAGAAASQSPSPPKNVAAHDPVKPRYAPPVSDDDLEDEEEEEDEALGERSPDDFDDAELDETDDEARGDLEPDEDHADDDSAEDPDESSESVEERVEEKPKSKTRPSAEPDDLDDDNDEPVERPSAKKRPLKSPEPELEDDLDEDSEHEEAEDEVEEAREEEPEDTSSDAAAALPEPVETPRPAQRPRKRAGRGTGRTPVRNQKPKIVASVNPLHDEAVSAAATELAPHPGQDGGEELLDDEDRQAIDDFMAAARSPATVATFRADLRQFSDWCTMKGVRSFPAEPRIVAAWASFLAKKKGLKYVQIERRVAAISAAHAALEHPSPCQDSTVKNVLLGIKSVPESDAETSAPITRDNLASIMTDAPKTKRWRRNKALLLLGFSAGLRRSELVEVRLEGLRFDDQGLLLAIPNRYSSKMETVRIPKVSGRLCTVGAVARWIASSGITSGYLFRSTHDGGVVDEDPEKHIPAKRVTKIVKDAIKLIGLDPRRYDAKSLRAGYSEVVQAASLKTIKDVDYMRQAMRPQAL